MVLRYDAQVCEYDTLIQILCFWSLSIVLLLFKHNVSKTGFSARLQVKPIQLGPIDRAGFYLRRCGSDHAVGEVVTERVHHCSFLINQKVGIRVL
jgi:hypothetical protein